MFFTKLVEIWGTFDFLKTCKKYYKSNPLESDSVKKMKSKDWHVKDFDIYSGTFDDFKRLVYYDLETFADEEEKLKGLLLGVWIFFNWYPILLILKVPILTPYNSLLLVIETLYYRGPTRAPTCARVNRWGGRRQASF